MTFCSCSRSLTLIVIMLFVLAACEATPDQSKPGTAENGTPVPTLVDTASPELPTTEAVVSFTPSASAEITDTPFPSPTSASMLWAPDNIPAEIASLVASTYQIGITDDKRYATLILDLEGEDPTVQWTYVLVAPFSVIPDGVVESDLLNAWEGTPGTGPFAGIPLLMDQDTYNVFLTLWGTPAPDAVQVTPAIDLLQTAWENQPSWAIIPFGQLEPRWKILKIDGTSPVQENFDNALYPLTVRFTLQGNMPQVTPIQNYDPEKLTDIMLTGVTALVRGTALTMERKDITYPGEDIALLTTQVDFMHVNNEVPFTPDCAFPELYRENLVFCSDPSYLELLEYIGTDFVEVSGDHFGDHGPEGTLYTLDLYDQSGLPYYGGGYNLEDARQPLLLEHNGNKIAVLGCNAKGSDYYAPADENTPGAVRCDFDWLEGEIVRLKDMGYQVIVTMQHIEYYSYKAQPDLVSDFGRMAAAGAVIVSGSQAHQAHGMAFADGAFIHYGLGNLFFDQYLFCEDAACDYAFMDRHIFYDGRYISTELIPIRFIDMARPRPMTADERAWFLEMIFDESDWK